MEHLQLWSGVLVTILATGVGVLPFALPGAHRHAERAVAMGSAAAAGAMLAASYLLVQEAPSSAGLLWGVLAGVFLVEAAQRMLARFPHLGIASLHGSGGRAALLAFVVLSVHSLAEGVAIGAGLAASAEVGLVVLVAMALQNIPEGLAMGALLVPRGVRLGRAAWLAVATSLPQLVAIPTWYLVRGEPPFLPFGLGFAAGAMAWLVLRDLVPDAKGSGLRGGVIAVLAGVAVLVLARLITT